MAVVVEKEGQPYDYIIIGAGIAGLIACRELLAAGFTVVVLEASLRVGGRTYSVPSSTTGVIEDLGAEWVQPRVHPLLMAELQRYGLGLEEGSEADGECSEGSSAPSPSSPAFAALFARIDADSATLPLDALYTAQLAPLDIALSEYLRSLTPEAATVAQLESLFFPFSGTPASAISALAMLREVRQFGGTLAMLTEAEARVQGGTQALCQAIHAALPAGTVRLGCAATGIREASASAPVAVHCTALHSSSAPACWQASRGVLVAIPFNALPSLALAPALPSAIWQHCLAGHAGACAKTFLPPQPAAALAAATAASAGSPALAYPGRCRQRVCLFTSGPPPPALRGLPTAAFHDWAADPLSAGTWVAPRPGQLPALEALRVHGGRVRFLGGDLALAWPGWMEGAVASALHCVLAVQGRGGGEAPLG